MYHQLGKHITNALDMPAWRWLLAMITSANIMLRKGKWAKVGYENGFWVHYYRDGVIVDGKPTSQNLDAYKKISRDNWGFLYTPQTGDIVLDIGAGMGREAYYFSTLVGARGKVVCVEAHPKTYQGLEIFCRYNSLGNVVPVHAAISDVESEVSITDDAAHIRNTILNSTPGQIMVKSIPLDLLFQQLNLDKVDYMKMNIEGAEKRAILGMTSSIRRVKYLCISCHDFLSNRMEGMQTKAVVRQFLLDSGFAIVERSDTVKPWLLDQINAVNPKLQ